MYCAFTFIARLLEAVIRYTIENGRLIGSIRYLIEQFSWHRFLFVQLWVFVLFLIYTTGSELNRLLGDGELQRVFFTRRSSDLKLTRRQRIRAILRLSRLTERYSWEELRDRDTAASAEVFGVLRYLSETTRTPERGPDPAAPGQAAISVR